MAFLQESYRISVNLVRGLSFVGGGGGVGMGANLHLTPVPRIPGSATGIDFAFVSFREITSKVKIDMISGAARVSGRKLLKLKLKIFESGGGACKLIKMYWKCAFQNTLSAHCQRYIKTLYYRSSDLWVRFIHNLSLNIRINTLLIRYYCNLNIVLVTLYSVLSIRH